MDQVPEPPSVKELERVLWGGKKSGNHVDEVWPNLFLGNMSIANDRYGLWKLGITHVLNAAHGRMHCQGSHEFYGSCIDYHGVPAEDSPAFDLSPYLCPSAEFIHNALTSPAGRILVHCAVGVSRSATLVLAYLMIYHNFPLLEAIKKVKENRWIFPNRGFLKQLRALDMRLHQRLERMAAAKFSKKEYLSVKDLEKVLDSCKLDLHQIDEVWPNIYIGNVAIAQNRTALQRLGITHILNAAHSKRGSIGDQSFYGTKFVYFGIPADDSTHFDLDIYFRPAADFIHKALKTPDGKILVHCIMGMSRSSTLVLAYLMLYHHMPLRSAIQKVIQKRAIYPNRNFLALLLDLDLQLKSKPKTCTLL
ncbi:dual specificity protein phosphatase 26 [Chanos chanos]|uniref:Dual specificity phosphatase 29 n=1 Tax=Chanos chanos TaxID=29144 RepID=A0A6J2VFX5_CHACN|nr:dual specificity protein phosphatase 26-like [Chanos chanos]